MVAFYIDSAERGAVEPLLATGLFAGVTTNPAILDKAGLGTSDVPDVIGWATDAGAQRVFAQVWGGSAAEMIDRGETWRALSDRLVVKVPYSRAGIEAAGVLSQGGEVLVTAIHDACQVLPVAISGAAFLAPFLARMDAAGRDGLAETLALQQAISATGARLQVLAGSVRRPAQILALAQGGVQNVTFGPAVWDRFFADDITRAAVENFEQLATADPGSAR